MEQTEVVPGSEEYNQLMADKFRNPGTEEDIEQDVVPVPDMPAEGVDKYYDNDTGAYNWEAHARELLFNANGRPKDQEEKTQTAEKAAEEPSPEAEEQEVSNILVKAGLDTEEIGQKIIEQGDLSSEDYEALKKVGIPEDLIKSYVQSYRYQFETERKVALEYLGGEEQWAQTMQWAQENLSETEVTDFNNLLSTSSWRLAADGLKARMSEATGTRPATREPTLIRGENSAAPSSAGYRSKAEMKADMSSKEYTTSPKFREQVIKKIQTATWDLDN